MRPRSRDDLMARRRTHEAWADATWGLLGRSPDHVGSFITGMACKPDVFDLHDQGFSENIMNYWRHIRDNDLYLAYAVVPPAGIRDHVIYDGEAREDPGLRVVSEDDSGVVISGMKMLATGAVFANEILIGNLTPLASEFKDYAITCMLACDAPGLSLWARKPYATGVDAELDYPLSYKYDEGDAVVVCEDVHVGWEKVFVHDDAELSRACYIETPANCFSNHQSNVRFWSKMSMLVGLASRVCQSTGNDKTMRSSRVFRSPRKASAGGQDEQPWLVNSSTTALGPA